MRLLHTMIRTGDLDRSIAFYTDALGMRLLRRQDYPEGKFTLAFVGSVISESIHSRRRRTRAMTISASRLCASASASGNSGNSRTGLPMMSAIRSVSAVRPDSVIW